MGVNSRHSRNNGLGEITFTRYFALYFTQIGWVALGVYLLTHAFWPSACTPTTLLEVYKCSALLPDSRGWIEAALMTWLWSTPLLLALELLRRFEKPVRR